LPYKPGKKEEKQQRRIIRLGGAVKNKRKKSAQKRNSFGVIRGTGRIRQCRHKIQSEEGKREQKNIERREGPVQLDREEWEKKALRN